MKFPMISCLMVTKRLDNKLTFQAIDSFVSQDYGNKELIVVYSHSTEDKVNQFIDYCYSSEFRPVMYKVKEITKLGEARNISIDISGGEYVCQWDDDDISHRNRLTFQYEHMKNYDVSLLAAQYHQVDGKIYVEQRHIKPEAVHSAWPGTVMGKKRCLLNIYPKWDSIGEDTKGLQKLENIKVIHYNSPFFHYLYRFNGNNTWDKQHNEMMIRENTYCDMNESIKSWIEDGFKRLYRA